MCDGVKFSVMSSLFSWMQRSKSAAKKRLKFRKFLDHFCKPGDYFGAIRLILPSLDRERGSYGLKESVLATSLIDALGMARDSEDAVRLINWRKGGAAKAGANAGNFAAVATEVLQRRQGMTSGGLTIRELNELLDRLASSENRAEKTSVLGELIRKTNAQEMKWIVMIILKDLKLGVSEKSIFHEFHPDAEDLFNVTCDLKLVCEKLSDRSRRHKRQDIEVGKAVRPQLAMRVGNAAAAWKKLHGKEVVLECKFDGDRIQIHKNGSDIHFFSRNFFDHPEYEHGMSSVILENVLVDRCILDGEMLVWDMSINRFAEFGSNQEIAKAAREGLQSDRQVSFNSLHHFSAVLCTTALSDKNVEYFVGCLDDHGLYIVHLLTSHIIDVAFDILYVGDTSVIHQSLKERHELLKKVVKPLKGRLEILVPNGGLNKDRAPGEPCWSLLANNVGDVEKFFKETIENRDEGIVLKDLESKWEPSDRSGKWLKLKPEYVRAGSDLDVLIIGGYYGSGRHGGSVAQFLVGLAEKAAPNTYPRRFISFCRVGTGLSDEELDEIVSKLKPYFRKYEYPKKSAPSFYQVTNNSKERPDVWIENPEKSIILSITSDIRMIRSEVFAAPYSLRFPRIDRVRYDKPWHECLDVQSFVELVQSSNGTTQKEADYETMHVQKSKRQKSTKREKNKLSLVPSHFVPTDISKVKGETSIFSDMIFYFVNVPRTYSLETLHKMVIENGGNISMNLSAAVTHCIAAECKGIKFEAAKRRGDVIHYSWFLDCCSQNKLIHLQPKYFLFLSDSTKRKLQDEIDEFSDSYYWDLSVEELKQIMASVKGSEDIKRVEYYRRKYCPSNKWCFLSDCCIQFHIVVPFSSTDWEDVLKLTMRRLRVEVTVRGGKVCQKPSQTTHLVILSVPGFERDFETFTESFPPEDQRFLHRKGLFIVQSTWLEDCFYQEQKLPEVEYNIKPDGFELLTLENELVDDEPDAEESSASLKQEPQSSRSSRKHEEILSKGKRGRPATRLGNTRKRKAPITPPRRTHRPRITKRAAKIEEGNEELETCFSSDDMVVQDEVKKPSPKLEEDEFETGTLDDMVGRKEDVIIRDNDLHHHPTRSLEEEVGKPQDCDMVGPFDIGEREERDRVEVQLGKDRVAAGHSSYRLGEENEDPIQAMLHNLLPSLGTQSGEAVKSSPVKKDVEVPVPADTTKAGSSSVEEVKQEPAKKKKKVSYKDVANELLKDW